MAFLFLAAAGSAGSPKKPPAFWGAFDCRGMLSMFFAYPTDSLFPCPSVPSVGGYISLPLSSVLISLRSNDRVAYGEAEELSMLFSYPTALLVFSWDSLDFCPLGQGDI